MKHRFVGLKLTPKEWNLVRLTEKYFGLTITETLKKALIRYWVPRIKEKIALKGKR